MQVLKTPDAAFDGLPDYHFAPHYVDVGGVDMHYVLEGPDHGPVIVLVHGQPSWSYLYRHTIKDLAAAGYRVYAPDLIGFGRSDKPADQTIYTYAQHVTWLSAFFSRLDLKDVSVVLHDWGGSIGLCVIAADPGRFARVVATNTAIVDGTLPMPEAWERFRDGVAASARLDVGALARDFCLRPMTDNVASAYDAPFPTRDHEAGPRAFPTLVPVTPDDPGAEIVRGAWKTLESFDRPFLTIYGQDDRIYAGAEQLFIGRVPGTEQQDHVVLDEAGHFIQEDQPRAFNDAILSFLKRSTT